jgi:hypothetical protein
MSRWDGQSEELALVAAAAVLSAVALFFVWRSWKLSTTSWPVHVLSLVNLALLFPWAFLVVITIMGGPMTVVLSFGVVDIGSIALAYIALACGSRAIAKVAAAAPLVYVMATVIVLFASQ